MSAFALEGGVVHHTYSCYARGLEFRRGVVRPEDADEYVAYVRETGVEHYRTTPGNQGAWILRRPMRDLTEVVTFSLWESMASVRAFAGDDPSRAVYYPNDDRFLVERSSTVEHYEVG
jgi:heme-degrading monooxygenase HmoA